MRSLNKEAIDVLTNKPNWFQYGFHAKTGETIDLEEFEEANKSIEMFKRRPDDR